MRFGPAWSTAFVVGMTAMASCGPAPTGTETSEGVGAYPDFTPRGDLSIYAIDVGNGDATLVLGPPARGGHRVAMLIDSGKLRPDGGRIVTEVLEGAGIDEIEFVVATHYDSDHIGGFARVLGGDSVLWADDACTPGPHAAQKAIIDLGVLPATSSTLDFYLTCVARDEARGVEHVVVRDGDNLGRSFELGGGYSATLVAGDGYVIDTPDRVPYVNTANERSIAVLISGPGGFDFLVTGDLTGRPHGSENARVEPVLGAALAARGVDLEVLHLGHHGGDNASSPEFLAALRPEVGVISVSAQNTYGHPGCDTYQSLADLPIQRVVQTQAGATVCPAEALVQPLVADGTIGIFATGGRYEVASLGDASSATDRPTQLVNFTCTVAGGCDGGPSPLAPGPGDLNFTEIMTNPDALSDSQGEWFELAAVDPAQAYDLTGCWIRDDGRDAITLADGVLVPAGAAITFARSADPGFTPTVVYGSGLTLANSEDELELVCDGQVIDRVAWKSGFPLRAGASMSLDPNQGDANSNDDPATWCLATLEYATDLGTPNGPNPPCR